MWIVRLALRRPFTVAAFCLVVLLLGVLSTTTTEVDIFPAINIPVVVVVWNYPGMSAEDLESRVTFISERSISTSVSGVTRIDSQTIDSNSILRVYFETGSDIGSAIAQITSTSLTASRVMPPDHVADVDSLMTTPVTPGGGATPMTVAPTGYAPQGQQPAPMRTAVAPYLGAFSSVRRIVTRSTIHHDTVQPTLDVECGVEGRDLGGVARDIDAAVKRLGKLPPGVDVKVMGQPQTMFTAFGRLALGMLVAIALVYLLLVVLFQSWIDPLLIMLAVPASLSGVLWMLAITGTTLNVESLMGAIMAIGIAASNSILLVHFANDARLEDENVGPADAAASAGVTRLRPVLMTATAMILGMLPMALGLGEAGQQNAPLGRAVIGGLLVSTFATLIVIPCAYAVLRGKRPVAAVHDRAVADADRAHLEMERQS